MGGVSDFLSGTNSRRIGTLPWMFCTQAVSVVAVVVWLVLSGERLPPLATLAAAAGAGVALLVGLFALFQAMVIGSISIVAPISATGIVIPVVAGVVGGEHPSAAQIAGIVAAVLGIVLASRVPRAERGRDTAPIDLDRSGGAVAAPSGVSATAERPVVTEAGLGLALLAAVGGGVWFWLMEPASRHGGMAWVIFVVRVIPVIVLGAVIAARRESLRPAFERRTAGMIGFSAVLALSAIAFYGYATLHGQLVIVSVLASLYPVVTVLLAYHVLGERFHRDQRLGIAAVLAGVVLLST
jgi:drug/metabolite transporter (DMT)-like permease